MSHCRKPVLHLNKCFLIIIIIVQLIFVDLLYLFQRGKYEEILQIPMVAQLFQGTDGDSVSCRLVKKISQYLNQEPDKEINILLIGVVCLQLYIQNNWTGPESPTDPITLMHDSFRCHPKDVLDEVSEGLFIDGEYVYNKSRYLLYLYFAKCVLLDCKELLKFCMTLSFWLFRFLAIYQSLLEERSPTIKATVEEIIDSVTANETLITNDKYRDILMQFFVEAGYLCYFFYEPEKAKEFIQKAKKLSGLSIELTGAMGKRTRFQQTAKAQLILQVKRIEECVDTYQGEEGNPEEMPKNLPLDDDTVLNRIELSNPDDIVNVSTSPVEQAVIISISHDYRRTHEGQGKIVEEEMLAYVNSILDQPCCWAVQCKALLTRAKWEWESPRRVQRSMMQLEELVNQCHHPSPNPASRLYLVNAVDLPPKWEIERQLASLLMKLGATNAALEIYERLQSWNEVIKCYTKLSKVEKGEALIRQQLAIKETPDLYCYLGEITGEPRHYEKAWEVSKCKSSKAQRMLGLYYLSKQKFEESLPCFEKSLSINSLQVGIWFSYGCAAIGARKFDVAAKAFRRCVNLTNDNFEAWNNLATAYIRSNQKPRAFMTLQEALKCSYDNWRIWENLMLVATDIGEFGEVIKAYHRLIELKHKHEDVEVLEVLVKTITENIPDSNGQPSGYLKPKALELFGRITSVVTSNADIWRLYSQLVAGKGEDLTPEEREKCLSLLQKSHRCVTQAPSWEKDSKKCLDIIRKSHQLAKLYQNSVKLLTERTQKIQLLSSCKLMLKGVITKIKQNQVSLSTGDVLEDLKEPLEQLEGVLLDVVQIIDESK